MSRSSAPVETFVSSLDFTFPDEWQSDGEDEATVASGSSSAGTGSTGGPGPPTKGRNSASIVQPGSRARASKMTAIEALTTRAEKARPDAASSKRNPTRIKIPRAPPLDFSSLRTSAPRLPNPPPRPPGKESRMFGLEHAPVYHPTIDEFANPLAFVESIAQEAKEYGICKIVPPEGWRPPFALNTEVRLVPAASRGAIYFFPASGGGA